MDPQSHEGIQPPASLVFALRRVMRPLVRLLLAKGITYPFLANFLKSIYVEVASEVRIAGKAQTDSRISLLTGVHRKDVKRLSREPVAESDVPSAVSLGAQLVAVWTGSERYLDQRGKPAALPRRADAAPSFEELVASVSKDIRARAVLDEWLRLGVVHLDSDDRVQLNMEAFVPQEGFDEKAHYFGQNVHDHIAAGTHNLLGGQPPFLERSVFYDGLTAESVKELSDVAREAGMQAVQAVNRRAMELERADAGKPGAGKRINFGIYFYSDEQDQGTDSASR